MTNQKYFRFQSADIEELFTEGDILLIRNDSFMAEVEALRKDAARYRHLISPKTKMRVVVNSSTGRKTAYYWHDCDKRFYGGAISDFIDAEITAGAKEKTE
jgi:hypothetical protein